MNEAAGNGHLEMVQWLHFNRTEGCTTSAMNLAVENSHLEVIKWLHFNRPEGCTTIAMTIATRKNHPKIIEWLQANIKVYHPVDMHGNIARIKYKMANSKWG
jgi:hypothetical protein